jgi:glyoxylase-like metal-dependent hydrolase (beta-lactamase superfamily II)
MKSALKTLTFLGLLFLMTFQASAQKEDHLLQCWKQQVKPLQGQYFNFSYEETLNELYHSPEPWQQLNYKGTGMIWCNAGNFLRQDTLIHGKRILYSKTQFNKDEFLYVDYGRKELSTPTPSIISEQLINTARYLPTTLINYCFQQKILVNKEKSDNDFAVYSVTINKTIVALYIDKHKNLLGKITVLNHDELHGDVLSTFTYSNYTIKEKLFYPQMIEVEKMNGKLNDEIKILNASLVNKAPQLLNKPDDYKVKEDIETKPEIKVEKYSNNIHFIDLIHAGAKAMVVEFSNFLLVAEAPLSSENGELIISEARKIAPGKPIKYFTFGHHHPHYLGGMRAFIHKGASVLSTTADVPYIKYLANAQRTLSPDSLQLEPKPLQIEEIRDSTTITDGQYELKIYAIGKKSGHTSDYLIYYFPEEKLLFEGDLVWIEKKSDPKKAGVTQTGLYNTAKEMGLNVKTIIQSWVTSPEVYKTVIPFEDLEQAMNVK